MEMEMEMEMQRGKGRVSWGIICIRIGRAKGLCGMRLGP
jgi:hypothetical protein